ncbi:MAG: response regulator [Planctomycetes bacterium]|nr:response regulator [Planctomycetota bacterium]
MTFTQSMVHVVDDNAEFRALVGQMLTLAALPSRLYGCAEEFLDRFSESAEGPQCLVLDMLMPGMGGMALMDRLSSQHIALPVIFVTAQAEVSQAVAAIKRGAVDFLEKPMHMAVLKECIVQALDKDGRRRRARLEQASMSDRLAQLSEREREVKDLLLAGQNAKQIATLLSICPKTAMKHRSRILEKMGVESIVQLFRLLAPNAPAQQ